MPFLLDGHNLIPKINGLSLRTVDDEERLIALLQVFCRVRRAALEVYFDQAPAGRSGTRRAGTVRAHFVSKDSNVDAAIASRLRRLKNEAANWTVVSSDQQVRAEARAHHARVLSSEEFANQLQSALSQAKEVGAGAKDEASLSPAEVQEWLDLFRRKVS